MRNNNQKNKNIVNKTMTVHQNNNKQQQQQRKGYQKVIGTKDVYVKVGSLDELLYWKVIHRTPGYVGSTKQFYISPVVSPGYSQFIKDPVWQESIKNWSQRRSEYLKKINDTSKNIK